MKPANGRKQGLPTTGFSKTTERKDGRSATARSLARVTIIGRGPLVRTLSLPITGLSGLTSSHLIVGRLGLSAYGIVSFLIAIPYLVPFADLGLGAAVTNVAGNANGNWAPLKVTWRYAARRLSMLASFLLLALWLGVWQGWWSSLLGLDGVAQGSEAVGGAFSLFLMAIPLGLGSRVLIGLGRSEWAIGLQALAAPVSLALIWFSLLVGARLAIVTAAAIAGYVVAAALCTLLAIVCIAGPEPSPRVPISLPRSSVKRQAAWMMLISISIPLTFQTDRLFLSIRGNGADLATYAVLALLFSPGISIIQATEMSLWGHYAGNRQEVDGLENYITFLCCMLLLGVSLDAGLIVTGPPLGNWVAHSHSLSKKDFGPASVLLLVMALHAPGHMFLTDEKGLRFQSSCYILMAVCSVAITWLFIPLMGAQAPIVGSAVGLGVFLLVPVLGETLRRIRAQVGRMDLNATQESVANGHSR